MKKFFSAFLLMTAMVLSVGTFVACNDLTEEMETVQTQATSNAAAIKALGDQITALQQALATAQSTADAAKAAGEEAKAAAAQAKADAIKEAKAECETLKAALEAKINENADAIVKLTALVNTKIEAIDAELAKMATIAKVDEAVANLVKADTDIKVQIEAIKKYAADSLVTIKMAEDMRAELLAADATLGKALQDSIAVVMAYAEELEETITNGIEGLQEKVDAVTARVEKLEAAVTKMDANLKTLTTFAYTSLRSLVFVPDFYYGGIEATEYTYMEYLTKAGDATKWTDANHAGKVDDRNVTVKIISAEKEWNYKTVVDKKGVEIVNFKNPVKYVSYWMNPSNADIAGADLAFISKDVLSKASKVAPQVAGDYQVVAMKDDEGKIRNAVKVPMVVDGKYLNANENPADTARVFALSAGIQANAKDTTIVSDYARLQSSELQLEGLAYTKVTDAAACAAQKTNHLYTDAYEALKAVPTLAVKYDGSIDLRKQIETHYTINGTDVASYEKNYMAEGTPAYEYNPYGLKWNFALIDYVTGNNKTSDTKHCTLAGSVLTPCGVDAQGNPTGAANVVSVGKRPLVRVTVTDANDAVILVGYIKLEIVRQVDYVVAEETAYDVVFSCNPAKNVQTWAQFVTNVLDAKTDYSKEEFEAIYKLEVENGAAVQYTVNNKGEIVKYTTPLGTVTEQADPTGTTTNVLVWDILSTQQEKVFEKANSTETIYVRYILKTSGSAPATQHEGIYVPLKVTVTKPQGKVTKKISEYWFNDKAMINVQKPTDNGSTESWLTPINQVWEGNVPNFNAPKKYLPAAAYGTSYNYYFAAVQPKYTINGTEYQLAVENNFVKVKDGYDFRAAASKGKDIAIKDNAELPGLEYKYALDATKGVYANNTLYAVWKSDPKLKEPDMEATIATIDANGVIKYERNATSMLLLNAYASYTRDNVKLFANIGVVASIGDCKVAFSLTENETNAYAFLRPINVEPKTGAQFVDGQDNGSSVDVMDLVKITDWRNEDFAKVVVANKVNTYPNGWYFAYYDVYKVTVHTDKAMCTLNQTGDNYVPMKDVTSYIKISHVPGTYPTTADFVKAAKGTEAYAAYKAGYGVIKYENNGNNVADFKIKVPVTFSYDWGEITVDAVIPVVKTMGN